MADLEFTKREIARMRQQVLRQRREILQLQRAGIKTGSAEALLERMLTSVDALCEQRDQLKAEAPSPMQGKVLGGRKW